MTVNHQVPGSSPGRGVYMIDIKQKLEKLPEYWQRNLLDSLNKKEFFNSITEMIKSGDVIIKDDNYQIFIHLPQEIIKLKYTLRQKYENQKNFT